MISQETHPPMRQLHKIFHWEQLPWRKFWWARFSEVFRISKRQIGFSIFGLHEITLPAAWSLRHPVRIAFSEVFRIFKRQIGFSIFGLHEITLPAAWSFLEQEKEKQKQSHPLQRLQLECEQCLQRYRDFKGKATAIFVVLQSWLIGQNISFQPF